MAEKSIEIKNPSYQYTDEFAEIMEGMVDTIFKRMENNTFKKLNESTKNKFEDAQVGNFSKVFLTMSNKAKRMIIKQFSDKRIERFVNNVLSKVNTQSASMLYNQIESITGVSQKALISREGLGPTNNALMLETAQWAKKLRDNSLESFVSNSLRGMAEGKAVSEIITDLKLLNTDNKARANTIARTQVSTYNTLISKARAKKVGVEKAVWDTSLDGRERASHRDRNGKEFDIEVGLKSSLDNKTLLPGVDYNCRCTMRLILPDLN